MSDLYKDPIGTAEKAAKDIAKITDKNNKNRKRIYLIISNPV